MIDSKNKDYVDAAKSWETDAVVRSRRSERMAWRVAIGACVLAVVSTVAIAGLTPFKEVEPFVVRVDKNTGFTDIITGVDEKTMAPEEAIDKFFLADYVRAREGYSWAFAYANYEKVDLMSSPEIGKEYYGWFSPDNPASPFNVYGDDGKMAVEVLSISFLDRGVASVRYQRTDAVRGREVESRWIATVGYEYRNPPLNEAERLVNPLGFQVIDYRTDSESAPQPAPAAGGS